MLVLASSSIYRRELLQRLGLSFETASPDVDETPLLQEIPSALSRRLADAKARSVGERLEQAWIIGSDQVAQLDGQVLRKPGSFERAADQLAAASGQRMEFHTSVCLYHHEKQKSFRFTDLTVVRFRKLSNSEIERYLHAEQPYDCAGSFKAEGLGICLFEAIESSDPTALIGLPLIGLSQSLRQAGFRLP